MTSDRRCLAPKSKNSHERCPYRSQPGSCFCGHHRNSQVKYVRTPSSRTASPMHDPIQVALKRPIIRVELKNRTVTQEELREESEISLPRYIETLEQYHLSSLGSIKELRERLTSFYQFLQTALDNPRKVISIQRAYLKWRYLRSFGATHRPDDCNNTTEMMSTIPLKQVPKIFFYSIRDPNSLVYGFDIRVLHGMITCKSDELLPIFNPYTRATLSQEVLDAIHERVDFLASLGLDVTPDSISYGDAIPTTDEQLKKFEVIGIFHTIQQYGYPVDYNWFLKLTFKEIKDMYLNLEDIWSYRLNLTTSQKQRIVNDPSALLDRKHEVSKLTHTDHNYHQLVNILIKDIKKMISEGITRDDRANGIICVLFSLVQVNHEAARALPMLTYAVGLSDD